MSSWTRLAADREIGVDRGPRPTAEEDALFDLLTRNMLPATIAA
jgi:hypothetical protein